MAALENPTPLPAAEAEMVDAPTAQFSSSETVDAAASSTAQAAPPTSAPPTTRSTPARASARGAAASGRFLPRAIRRSQLDRDTIAAKESAKQETKAAVDARLQRAARGGRGGGRRARGGPPAGFDRIIRGGTGGFGSTIQASSNRGGPSSFARLYDAPSAGGSRSGTPSAYGGGLKKENGLMTYNSESSRPTGRRMNTDKIAEFITIDDDEAIKSKEGTPVLLPKGMFREDPKEPDQPEIATTEEVKAAERGEPLLVPSGDNSEDGDVFYNENDVEMKDDDRKWPGAKELSRVKIEGEEITEIDMLTQRRAEKELQAKDLKRKMKYKDDEDRLDAEKMAYQRKLFGITSSDDDSDDEFKEDKTERKPLIAEGAIYLWQFPPVMPPLYKVEKTSARKSPVKDEPDDDDVVILNAPSHKSDKPVDLTAADDIKDEDESGAGLSNGKGQPEDDDEELSGLVGKLIIRKSGKMQIDWGGMLFDCESGIPVSHYREAVVTVEDDEKHPDGFHGTAYGMGAVAGKFNAVPHWSDVKPWIVDPSQLPPWGVGAAPEGTDVEE
ncbi:hypothetical protein M406DRAFT_326157 [Cryphonectria parasitica EP155]|uniref:DNA-directed RNA polymerase III RPC4 n=1 Tax=Cryphonectria parasitica (strain ATCC 38755 / EP155) TaxID=660469 RepID=A0A9P5CTK5_CRYP1|nr:uncharacterized protein M406DRAFT_326157 [Cryphonectria parasitica EP155]KAF3770734.1 hypothetical protein M406DRAFT_326157 [Cryphonectria parasitica EP155]